MADITSTPSSISREQAFGLFFAQTKLVAFATSLALNTKNRDVFEVQGEIHWLHYFASELGRSIANDRPYIPAEEVLYQIFTILKRHNSWHASKMVRHNEGNRTAGAAADALYGVINRDFDETIIHLLDEKRTMAYSKPMHPAPTQS